MFPLILACQGCPEADPYRSAPMETGPSMVVCENHDKVHLAGHVCTPCHLCRATFSPTDKPDMYLCSWFSKCRIVHFGSTSKRNTYSESENKSHDNLIYSHSEK